MLKKFPKIFLTGATGWLGQRVVEALTTGLQSITENGGYKLHCLVPAGEPTKLLLNFGVDITVGSLNDEKALQSFLADGKDGLLIHIAGLIHPQGILGRTKEFNRINFDGTRGLMNEAIAAGVSRAVIMSSNSPFGANVSNEDRFTEESPFNPYMGYGKSKWLMELMLRDLMGKAYNPEIVIVRAPWFYGPGQPPRQTLFFKMIKEGKFPVIGDGLNRRSMGYVDNLVSGLILAASKPDAANQTFWLADEQPYTMLEIVETVRNVLNDDFGIKVTGKTRHFPSVISDVARICDSVIQSTGFYQQKIHILSEMNMTIACDITKAREVLGYKPLIKLRDGMHQSIKWCLDRNINI